MSQAEIKASTSKVVGCRKMREVEKLHRIGVPLLVETVPASLYFEEIARAPIPHSSAIADTILISVETKLRRLKWT